MILKQEFLEGKKEINVKRTKDKGVTILYAVPISLWPLLSKENWYFYTRYS